MAMYVRKKKMFDWQEQDGWHKVVKTYMSRRPSGLIEMAVLEDGRTIKADYTTESIYVFEK